VESLIISGAMAFIVLLTRIAIPITDTTAWDRHVAPIKVVPLRKRPFLTNAKLSDAYQTLSAKPLMESALVSSDIAVPNPTARQQKRLCQRGVKVCHAITILNAKPKIASLESAKRSIFHQAPHRPRPRTRHLNLFQTHHQLKLRFQ
jgi:hypothetical protein